MGRDRLVLEITEGALMEQFDTAVSVVAALLAAGVSGAVDDFGRCARAAQVLALPKT
jgi:EAL domain-containing protein (putative c-di-GMP-specific phosphodiesterase class I)